MPEGPEIKTLEILLNKKLKGQIIENIQAFSKTPVNIPKKSQIVNIGSKGKLLWIRTKDYYIHIHLSISGWITINSEPDYTKYIIEIGKNKIYVDSMRKFSKVSVHSPSDHDKIIKKLGVNILSNEFTLSKFIELIKLCKTMIVSFLLDQKKLAGVGNYIKNEALYIAKIRPRVKTNDLSDSKIKKLFNAIRHIAFSILLENVNKRDVKANVPVKLEIPYTYKVYNQQVDPKGQPVIKEKIGGRWTYYIEY